MHTFGMALGSHFVCSLDSYFDRAASHLDYVVVVLLVATGNKGFHLDSAAGKVVVLDIVAS